MAATAPLFGPGRNHRLCYNRFPDSTDPRILCFGAITRINNCPSTYMEVLVRNLDEFFDLSLVFIQRSLSLWQLPSKNSGYKALVVCLLLIAVPCILIV